ncbi:Conserved_hypothetical protein [Hexamita inflata]|uniref:Uncharacterized protein n=1 Tax=Hexamita inflata TaxID=28002 RepID=A0AA86UMS9_9EUKA|nr:Conserved hypothetical protein [Hexamita inflata]
MSSSSDTPYTFIPPPTTTTSTKFKRPNYKNIQILNIIILSVLYMLSQVISQFCSSNARNVMRENQLLNLNQFYLIYNAVLCFMCVFTNVVFEFKSEIELFKISCLITVFQTQIIICTIIIQNVNEVVSNTYAVTATILGGCGYIINKLACFSYMFKCLPKNADSGIIFAIFNSFHVFLQILDTALKQFGFYNIYVMYACATAMIIIYFCYEKFLKVPSFAQIELRVQDIVMQNKPMLYTEIEQTEQPKQRSKLHSWMRFYAFMIFKSVNGILLMLLFAFCSFTDYTGQSYIQVIIHEYYSQYYTIKSSLQYTISQVAQVVFNIISSFCVGIYYDCLNEQNKMKKLLSIMNIVIFVELICLSIPNISDFIIMFYRVYFVILVIFVYGLQMMSAMLCSFSMFKGSMRMVVCFMFGIKHFVSVVQLTVQIYIDFFSQSYFVLVIFSICYISYVMVLYKTKIE